MEPNQNPQTWTWETAYKKWFFVRFILLLIALGLSIALLYIQTVKVPEYIRAANIYTPAEKTIVSVDSNQYTKNNIKSISLPVDANGWKIYRDESNGFEFKYPASIGLEIDEHWGDSVLKDIPSQAKQVLHVSIDRLDTVIHGDNPCDSESPELFVQKKNFYDSLKPGVKKEFSYKEVNSYAVPVMYSINTCQGLVEDNDPAYLDSEAVVFRDYERIRFTLQYSSAEVSTSTVLVKDIEKVAGQIMNGKYIGIEQDNFNALKSIVSTFKFNE